MLNQDCGQVRRAAVKVQSWRGKASLHGTLNSEQSNRQAFDLLDFAKQWNTVHNHSIELVIRL